MPKGEQGVRMEDHRIAQMMEDVLFLAEGGLSPDQIFKRVGMKKDAVEQAFRRHGRTPPWVDPTLAPGNGCTRCRKITKGPLHPGTYIQKNVENPLVLRGKFCSYTCYDEWAVEHEREHGPDARTRPRDEAARLMPLPINDR